MWRCYVLKLWITWFSMTRSIVPQLPNIISMYYQQMELATLYFNVLEHPSITVLWLNMWFSQWTFASVGNFLSTRFPNYDVNSADIILRLIKCWFWPFSMQEPASLGDRTYTVTWYPTSLITYYHQPMHHLLTIWHCELISNLNASKEIQIFC